MPVYNAEAFIHRCLKSLLIVEANKEIILIDDGSTDNSLTILSDYAKQYPNIHLLTQPNKGVSAARNLGIEQAQGRYIHFVDADDFLIYSHYASLIQSADYANVDITRSLHIEQDPSVSESYLCQLPLTIEIPKKYMSIVINGETYLHHAFNGTQFVACWLGLYRTAFLRQHQIRFNEEISSCEDNLFFIDCMLRPDETKVLYFPNYIYCYARHSDSNTKKRNNLTAFQDIFKVCGILADWANRFTEQDKPVKAQLTKQMIEYCHLYAYENFYLNFDDEYKQKANALFTKEFIAFLARHGHNVTL